MGYEELLVCLFFISYFFLGKKYHGSGKLFRAKIIGRLIRVYYQCDIPLSTDIHETVYFCHSGFGIVINPKTIIGEDTMIQHKVTLGEITRGVEPQ